MQRHGSNTIRDTELSLIFEKCSLTEDICSRLFVEAPNLPLTMGTENKHETTWAIPWTNNFFIRFNAKKGTRATKVINVSLGD